MLFSIEEVGRLLNIVDYRVAKILAEVLGGELLTLADKEILQEYKFDFSKLPEHSPYWQSYIFGQLAGLLAPEQLRQIGYKDFKVYLESNQFRKPTEREMGEYRAASIRSYSYIKGMGSRIKETLSTSIAGAESDSIRAFEEIKDVTVVKEVLLTGTIERKAVRKIVSDLGDQLERWDQDWTRIAETELQDIYNVGVAQQITKTAGIEALVYKDVFPGACKYCLNFYTTTGAGSAPRVFKMSTLISNGTNIGRKAPDWLPTIGTTHPFCRCDLREVPKGYEWNEEKGAFTMKPVADSDRVQRKSKVTIKVGTKTYEI